MNTSQINKNGTHVSKKKHKLAPHFKSHFLFSTTIPSLAHSPCTTQKNGLRNAHHVPSPHPPNISKHHPQACLQYPCHHPRNLWRNWIWKWLRYLRPVKNKRWHCLHNNHLFHNQNHLQNCDHEHNHKRNVRHKRRIEGGILNAPQIRKKFSGEVLFQFQECTPEIVHYPERKFSQLQLQL